MSRITDVDIVIGGRYEYEPVDEEIRYVTITNIYFNGYEFVMEYHNDDGTTGKTDAIFLIRA